MRTYTRRKKLGEERVRDTEDRLSNLPDGILTHILSYLLTKEVVRTSILSTRWKSIWESVPSLDLSEPDFCSKTERLTDIKMKARFLNFIDRVLMNHSIPALEKVVIIGSRHEPFHVESWICASVKRNVRELQLAFGDIYEEPPRELPQSLFSCNTLTVLKLRLDMVLNFPMASTCLRNLKVLQLNFLIYKDDISLQNLISSCPVLEILTIMRHESDNLRALNITSRTIKALRVAFRGGSEQNQLQKIVINASSLESIDIDDYAAEDYVVGELFSVIKAKLNVLNCGNPHMTSCAMGLFQLFRRMSNIKFLSLSSETMVSLSWAKSYNLPKFHHLTCLELFDDTDVDDISWKLMLEFLNRSPALEVLIFEGFTFSWYEEPETLEMRVPNCLVFYLKTIKIMKLRWEPYDVEKLRYFLKKSKVLDNLVLNFSEPKDEFFMWRVVENLQMLPWGSEVCEIEIC